MSSITLYNILLIPILSFILIGINLLLSPHNPYKGQNKTLSYLLCVLIAVIVAWLLWVTTPVTECMGPTPKWAAMGLREEFVNNIFNSPYNGNHVQLHEAGVNLAEELEKIAMSGRTALSSNLFPGRSGEWYMSFLENKGFINAGHALKIGSTDKINYVQLRNSMEIRECLKNL